MVCRLNISAIKKFWKWFELNKSALKSESLNDSVISQLDQKVLELDKNYSWEIGPGLTQPFFFSISPNLNKELLVQTKEIIRYAPKSNGWEFYPAKPAKPWNLKWEMEDENHKLILVDANDWEYILFQFEDGTYDIDVKLNGWVGKNEEVKYSAVEIALTGILGEEKFMNLIENVAIVESFSEDMKSNVTKISELRKHLLDQELNLN